LTSEIHVQPAYQELYKTDAKYIILMGGSGSGKSYAVADYVILSLLQGMRRWIITRKVAVTIRQSVFMLMVRRISDMGLSHLFRVNKSEMYIEGPNGSNCVFVGLDDVDKLKSIYDPTDAFIEEADQVSQADLEEIDRRIRTIGSKPRIVLSFNPTSAYSWIKRYFFDECKIFDHEILRIHTTYRDNKYLNPDYAQTIERLQETNPAAYRVYGMGEWGIVEGVIFDKWDTQDIPERVKLTGYGLDWGFTNDPTALIAVYESGDDVWLDELIYEPGLTNQDLGLMFQSLGVRRTDEIVADSAEPKSIEEIYRQGYNIHACVKGADSVRSGIAYMKSKRLHVTPRSTHLQKELSSYTWRQDKNGNWLNEPVDDYNHAIDAVRYRLTSKRQAVKAGNLKGLGI